MLRPASFAELRLPLVSGANNGTSPEATAFRPHHPIPERKDVIEGALAAVLAGEHVLLLGPPGTAKSALVRATTQAFGGSYFERLLTKFSTPEELFCAISLKAMEQDRFARVITGKLPEAEFAFVEENSRPTAPS
jgi:MoxR-like ATPase